MRFVFIENTQKSWLPFFEQERDFLKKAENLVLKDNICPKPENVMNFSKVRLEDLKVVILGQDPYPQKGTATGRAFEVMGLDSFEKPIRQASIKNILKALYKAYTNEEQGLDEIRLKIKSREFVILPPNELFINLEKQGVLFLNAYFTCREGMPLSHRGIWKDFSKRLISYISIKNRSLRWFLWGKDAQGFEEDIKAFSKIYKCRHPMMAGTRHHDDFLKCDCFADTVGIINWLGKT